MSDDLIALAERIATLSKSRPKQAHLRRAVSTAYYAVFHFLVNEACKAQLGSSKSSRPYRHALGRAFTHTVMKQACKSFSGGALTQSIQCGLPRQASGNYVIIPEIRELARLFVDLQELRQIADYDLSRQFKRSDVRKLIDQAKLQISQFRELESSDDRKFFLSCLWAWRELKDR